MKAKTLAMSATAIGAAILVGCSTNELMQAAIQKDPGKALKAMGENRLNAYRYNPQFALADLQRAQTEYNRLVGNLKQESGRKWGPKEAEQVPTKTRYVKYSEQYTSRVIVDFDQGSIVIEHLNYEGVVPKLRGAVVVALLTPGDPRAVDLFSDKPVELEGTPYLQGLVADQSGKLINGRADAERFADYLVSDRLQTRQIVVNGQSQDVRFVQIAMVNNHVEKNALRYSPAVHRYSDETSVSRSLIFAVMKTESGFNPFALSSAPAYGLMQLVPVSGGREAYRKAKGINEPPTKDYLFVPDNNIELGSTYLAILMVDSPLSNIRDPVSREYCAIAAYNTGPANVFRAFSTSNGAARQTEAIDRINSMTPEQVYATLRSSLPYAETRSYVDKVVSAKKHYAAM